MAGLSQPLLACPAGEMAGMIGQWARSGLAQQELIGMVELTNLDSGRRSSPRKK